jgi:C_GCAxxG_C_C family probable redox protein
MPTREEQAENCFEKGFNCAQAVFSAYAEPLGIPEQDALRVAAGFGGGMGRLQEVCGAVTGAFMVIGCRHGMLHPEDVAARDRTYDFVQQFDQRFRALHGSTNCRELLGCDLRTAEGKKEMKEKNLSKLRCARYVRDAVTIVEKMIE